MSRTRTGRRRQGSAGRAYCRTHPRDPSCFYPGLGSEYVDPDTGRRVDAGCIEGDRRRAGNPPLCDYRRVRRTTSLATPLAQVRALFGRIRVHLGNGRSMLRKYSPYRLDSWGWPAGAEVTEAECQRPTSALLSRLERALRPEFVRNGGLVWVNQRDGTLKCRHGIAEVRWPVGDSTDNRYFFMGISYVRKAMELLSDAWLLVFIEGIPEEALDTDENAALAYVTSAPLTIGINEPGWRRALDYIETRAQKRLVGPSLTVPQIASQLPPQASQMSDEELLGSIEALLAT